MFVQVLRFSILLFLFLSSILFAEEVPQEIFEMAKKELLGNGVLKNFDSKKFSFIDMPNVKLPEISLGTPVREYRIMDSDIEQSDEKTLLRDILKPTDRYMVPLIARGKIIVFLFYKRGSNGKYRDCGWGSDLLAASWNVITSVYQNAVFVQFGFIPYFHVPGIKNNENLTFINPNPEYRAGGFANLTSLHELLGKMKENIIFSKKTTEEEGW